MTVVLSSATLEMTVVLSSATLEMTVVLPVNTLEMTVGGFGTPESLGKLLIIVGYLVN